MVFNATFNKISVIDLIQVTYFFFLIKIYKTLLISFGIYLKRHDHHICGNKMILHHAYKYIFSVHKWQCMGINRTCIVGSTACHILFTKNHVCLLFLKFTYIIYLFVSIQGTEFLLSLQLRIIWKKHKFINTKQISGIFFIVIKEIGNFQISSVIA
jgi:hypothetical protein